MTTSFRGREHGGWIIQPAFGDACLISPLQRW